MNDLETLTIPVDRLQDPILRFIAGSPLQDCTDVVLAAGGSAQASLTRQYGALSNGEKELWDFLESLIRGPVRHLIVSADTGTSAALGDLFTRLTIGTL